MPATFQTDGAINVAQGGNDTGAACTLIGCAGNQSGPTVGNNFTSNAVDAVAWHIGGGQADQVAPSSVSQTNTGQVVNPSLTGAAGSGYNNGTFRIQSDASGGRPAGTAEVEITVVAGAIASRRVVRPGDKFTSAPTFNVANAVNVMPGGPVIGAGTLGTVVAAVGLLSQVFALGAAYGTDKNTQRLTAVGAVAIGAAVTPSTYLNRSPRALVAGDSVWAVEP